MDALGARRIPDPTTAGDFCRRFDATHIYCLQQIFNATRRKVWRQQPAAFFEEAILDADGTMVETTGEASRGDRLRGQRPLRAGEPAGRAEGRRTVADGAVG